MATTISGPVTAGSIIEPAGVVAADLPANGYVGQVPNLPGRER